MGRIDRARGACVNTGTIPSKTLREAVVYLTGMSQRELYGSSYRVKERITPADLLRRTTHVIGREQDVVRNQLLRNGVELFEGHGRFLDPHTLVIEDPTRDENVNIRARYVVIATGTKPVRPAGVNFDEERVLDSDGILDLKSLPQSMVVVGAGVIGIDARRRRNGVADLFRCGKHQLNRRAGHAAVCQPRKVRLGRIGLPGRRGA